MKRSLETHIAEMLLDEIAAIGEDFARLSRNRRTILNICKGGGLSTSEIMNEILTQPASDPCFTEGYQHSNPAQFSMSSIDRVLTADSFWLDSLNFGNGKRRQRPKYMTEGFEEQKPDLSSPINIFTMPE